MKEGELDSDEEVRGKESALSDNDEESICLAGLGG